MDTVRVVGLVVLAGLAAPGALAAPNFDCTQASDPIEKTICSDPKLSEMDRKLAARYRADLSKLSAEAQVEVRDSQRQWLKYVRTVCDTTVLPKELVFRPTETCLEEAYQDRIAHTGVLVQDGRAFYSVQGFKAHRSPEADDNTGGHTGFVTLEFSYPQIDGPKTPMEKEINAKLATRAKPSPEYFMSDSMDDDWTDIRIAAVRPALISFRGDSNIYGHGAAHGFGDFFYDHWLVGQGRELTAADIFSAETKWEDFLRATCFAAVKHLGVVSATRGVGDNPVMPSHWSFGRKGFTITFSLLEVGAYPDGEPEVTIPWDKLKPYLAPGAPAILAGFL